MSANRKLQNNYQAHAPQLITMCSLIITANCAEKYSNQLQSDIASRAKLINSILGCSAVLGWLPNYLIVRTL